MRAAPLLAALIKPVIDGNGVNGCRILGPADAMRDQVGLSARLRSRTLEAEGIAEPLEQRIDPGLAGHRQRTRLRESATPFVSFPGLSNIGEGRLHFGAEAASLDVEV